jgi:hypothetical protein
MVTVFKSKARQYGYGCACNRVKSTRFETANRSWMFANAGQSQGAWENGIRLASILQWRY